MGLIGYARISTHGQKEDSQVDELKAAGCERIFTDRGVSGKLGKRPELDACLDYLREGDVLVITRLSRAMRSIRHLLNTAHDLGERGIGLKVLKQQEIDTTSATGRFLFNVLAAVDELQREIIVEGTHEGWEAARARGRTGGRKPKLSPGAIQVAREMYDKRGADGKRAHTVDEIAAVLKVSRPTVYRVLPMAGTPGRGKPPAAI
jgi:DNA invertase Pin-like site-specific DNA recombinase